LHRTGLYHDVQVFQLSVLPGTAFRQEAAELGLRFQPRPPYYVLETPTMSLAEMADLMAEAQELFQCEFDAPPPPRLESSSTDGAPTSGGVPKRQRGQVDHLTIDLDAANPPLPPPGLRSQAMTIRLQSFDFQKTGESAAAIVQQLLQDNPHSTLEIVFDSPRSVEGMTAGVLELVQKACLENPSYLD